MRVVGVHYKRWSYLDYDPVTFIVAARALGYDQLELDAPKLLEMSVLGRTRLGFEARTHRIDLSYTWAPNWENDLASLDEQKRREALTYAIELVKVIGQMGGGSFNGAFYASFPPRWELIQRRHALIGQAVKSIKSLASEAEQYDVMLHIKPINRREHFLISTVDEALSFIQAVNHRSLGLDLDTYHLSIEEPSIGEALNKAGFSLKTLHIREEDMNPLGEGSIDWSLVRQSLDAIHYDGPLIHNPTVKVPAVDRPYESNHIRSLLVD